MSAAGRTVETVLYLAGFSNVKSKVCFFSITHCHFSVFFAFENTDFFSFADYWIKEPT